MFLHDAVEKYIELGRARFHMPGHKGINMPRDITEVEGCDSLYEANGAILKLEEKIARVYDAKASLLSVGGATLCIQTMLGLCGMGAKIIAGRGLHSSALNAMILLGQEAVWIYPEYAGWFRGEYSPEKIKCALEENPDAVAVYITSPDYFGLISDISAIAEICHSSGKILLVDNAHGAHLKFCGNLHPMDLGADMCADSLHKTLPAMTGGAVLHLAHAKRNEAKRMMSMFGSTSPSYPIMLSCESALYWAEKNGQEAFKWTGERFKELADLAGKYGFLLPQGERDPAKLCIGFGHFGISDIEFGEYLRKMGIEPEYIGGGVCVLMGNRFNSDEDYKKIERALIHFPAVEAKASMPIIVPHTQNIMSIREAAFAPSVEVPLAMAIGRIAARELAPCPPGIPAIICGERIDEIMAEYLASLGVRKIWVVEDSFSYKSMIK